MATKRMSDVSEEADAQSFVTARSARERSSVHLHRDPSVLAFPLPPGSTRPVSFAHDSNPPYTPVRSSRLRQSIVGTPRTPSSEDSSDDGDDHDHDDDDDDDDGSSIYQRSISVESAERLAGTDTALETTVPNGSTPEHAPAAVARSTHDAHGAHGLITTVPRRSRTSSFINLRWNLGRWSHGSSTKSTRVGPGKRPPVAPPRKPTRASAAYYAFWLGFIAGPWCWLLGGWAFDGAPGDPVVDVEAQRRHVLPLGNNGRIDLTSGSLQRPSPVMSWATELGPARTSYDPWVLRCRIAAGAGALGIVIALLIAAFVLASAR